MRAPGRPRSLRIRLVATVLLLLAAACALIGVTTTVALREFLYRRLDFEVTEAGQRFVEIRTGLFPPPGGGQIHPPGSDFLGPAQRPGTVGAVVRDGVVQRAEVSTRRGGSSPVPEADHPTLATVSPRAGPVSVDLSLGEYRLIATAVNGTVYVIGQPDAQPVIDRLVLIELIVIGVTLAGAGVAGAVLVRRELRPLERVADTAAAVSTLPLDRGEVELVERVPDVDPRTEVGQVAAALNRMLDNIGGALAARQDSERRLRQFIADASHELRTPLAAIRGYAELAHRAELAPETEYPLTRISSQAERMTTLVEDLLLLARLDAGRPLERTPVDLTRLVLDAVSDAHAVGPDHRWRLTLPEEPVTVTGDASRLAQILSNLLANARTHTPAGTEVRVELAREGSAAGGDTVLTVTDDGPGISPALLPHVFERFARGEKSRSRAQGSTGLGLAIVDAVVAAHHGTVDVRSAPGCTEFRVRLPDEDLPVPAGPDTQPVHRPATRPGQRGPTSSIP